MDEEKRIPLTHCIWCPMNIDGACVIYQIALENQVNKPDFCEYIALIRRNVKISGDTDG
jgi:hypothetical protein